MSVSSYTQTIDVIAQNDAPTAANNTVTTNEDTTYTFSAADFNYTDIDLDAMASIQITTLETVAALQLYGVDVILNQVINKADIDAGNLKFIPVANANGTGYDSFSFSVNDGTTDSVSSYTQTIDVTAVNDAPLATSISLNTIENTTASGVLNANDPDGDALTYSLLSNASIGVVTITNASTGTYSYTPNANATGTDSFTYRVNDGLLNSNTATVSVNITLVNVAPLASNATLNTNEDSVANGSLVATDGDSDPLIYSIVSNASLGIVALTNISTGTYTYTPNTNATGTDSFTFKVNDGLLDSNIATVSVNIIAVNDVPVATSASITVVNKEPVTVTLDAVDVDGDPLDYILASYPSQGTLELTDASIDTFTYTYTPNQDAAGTDSFSYLVNDAQVDSNIATVTILFQEVNVVNDDSASSSGSLNWFFVVLLSLLSGLRSIPVIWGQYSRTGAVSI